MAVGTISGLLADGATILPLAPAIWLGLAGLAMVGLYAWSRHLQWRRKIDQEDKQWGTGVKEPDDA